MSEMALTASHLIVIGRGRLIADVSVQELVSMGARDQVRVKTTKASELRGLLAGDGVVVTGHGDDVLEVSGVDSAYIGAVAARAGIALVELTPQQASLEEAFMEITRDSVEFATPDQAEGGLALAGRSSS